MKINFSNIMAVFGAVQTVAEVIKATVKVIKRKAPEPKADEAKDAEAI
jgi:hypothetical protein